MRYFVETVPAVREYFEGVAGLSPEGKAAVVDGYTEELGRDAERFLNLYPLGPESLHFRYDYAHAEGEFVHTFDFIVDGTPMPAGVVRVVYVEHSTLRLM
jgi:hypothetical protein